MIFLILKIHIWREVTQHRREGIVVVEPGENNISLDYILQFENITHNFSNTLFHKMRQYIVILYHSFSCQMSHCNTNGGRS